MDKLVIHGGQRLEGSVAISGSKNAALPLMCTALLTDEPVRLHNLPRLADITTLADLLNHHGATVTIAGGPNGTVGRSISLEVADIADRTAPYDMVRKMRASILVLGPMLARTGEAKVSLPGGCAIGTRPIDLHLDGLTALGAAITLDGGYVRATAPKGLRGGRINLPKVSVGATENLMMAASLARGETVIENAAREPEIIDLGRCLNAMGADITGLGSDCITIAGVERLSGVDHRVMPDRIEAGSYAVAAAITGGDITLMDADARQMGAVLAALEKSGASVTENDGGLRVAATGRLKAIDIETAPFPGFPTDMQAQFMALLSICEGTAVITETIFENRFMHAQELLRLGADITVSGAQATIRGVPGLHGAPVMATDLRASMGLVLAGLAASGETVVNRLYHLDRGYERLENKLTALGADVHRQPA